MLREVTPPPPGLSCLDHVGSWMKDGESMAWSDFPGFWTLIAVILSVPYKLGVSWGRSVGSCMG